MLKRVDFLLFKRRERRVLVGICFGGRGRMDEGVDELFDQGRLTRDEGDMPMPCHA